MAMKTYSLGADLVVHVKDDLSEISIREQWSGLGRQAGDLQPCAL